MSAKGAKPKTRTKKPEPTTRRETPSSEREPKNAPAAPVGTKPAAKATSTASAAARETKTSGSQPAALGVPQQRGMDGATLTRIWVSGAGLTLVLTVALGVVYGPPSGVLVLVTAAFTAVIALFWSSLRTLLGETALQSADAFAIGAPHGEDEQKRAVLRALKDLEFERSVGKISEDDYKNLVTRLRGRAKELLRQLDEAGAAQRARAEVLVEERARELRAALRERDEDEDQDDDDAREDDAADTTSGPAKPAKKTEAKKPSGDDDDDDDAPKSDAKTSEDDASTADASDDDTSDSARAPSAERDGNDDEDDAAQDNEDEDEDEDEDEKVEARATRGRRPS